MVSDLNGFAFIYLILCFDPLTCASTYLEAVFDITCHHARANEDTGSQ